MRNRAIRVFVAAALVFATLAVAALSRIDFYIAQGSDTGATIYRVSTLVFVVSIAVVLVAFLAATWLEQLRAVHRVLLSSVGLALLALTTHVVSFNVHEGSVDEFWFALRVPRAMLDAADGLEVDWNVRRDALGLVLTRRMKNEQVRVFTGVPPWAVDVGASL